MVAWFLCLCLCLLVCQAAAQCGLQAPTARILDGSTALPCSLPWHVGVHFVDGAFDIAAPPLTVFTSACAGVIIDENHVIFNPTCIFLFRNDLASALSAMVLAAGDLDLDVDEGTEQYRRATEIYFQPEYPFRTQQEFSIAATENTAWLQDYQGVIIRVNEPFVFGDCVTKVCPPEVGDDLCSYDNCVFSGNGLTSATAFVKSPQTQMTIFSPLSRQACAVLESSLGFSVPLGGTCAKPQSTGNLCNDDSGGALVCERNGGYFLRGTAVEAFCRTGVPAVFWDAALHVDFINDVISGVALPAATI